MSEPMSEDALFRAYRHIDRSMDPGDRRECCCGGSLSAPADDATRITFEVQQHQRTPMHAAWWTWQELLASRPGPQTTPALPAGDVSRPEDGLSAAVRTKAPKATNVLKIVESEGCGAENGGCLGHFHSPEPQL